MIVRNFPSCIFYDLLPENAVSDDRQEAIEVAKRIRHCEQQKSAVDMLDANAITYFPHALQMLGPAALRVPDLKPLILADPMACLVILASYYEATAEELEPAIMGNGEIVYNLLRWADATGAKLRLPIEVYEKALSKDPFWGILYGRQVRRDAVIDDCIRFAHANHRDSSGAAYLYVALHEEIDPKTYVNVLSLDPLYACLASKRFAARGFRLKASQIKGLTPRWAYHCLEDGIVDDTELLVDSLFMDPGWGLEWLKRRGDLSTVAGLKKYVPIVMERATKLHHPYLTACCNYVARVIDQQKSGSGSAAS